MANSNQANVSTPVGAYNEMAKRWELIDDLFGGTIAMRAASTKWLPMESAEQTKTYEDRLARTILYGAYKDSVETLVSKPFSKPINVTETNNEQLDGIKDDVDGQGTTLEQIAKDSLFDGINRGLFHILVDYPVTMNEEGKTPTLKEEREANIRPRFLFVSAKNLIGWKADENGNLIEIRITTDIVEPDGDWGEKTTKEILVYRSNEWIKYRLNEKKEYIVSSQGTHTFNGIPLVTGYINKKGFMVGEPAMEELAWTNLAHYQSDSDQRNILRFARVPMVFMSGLSQEEMEKPVVVGPTRMFKSTNPEAKMMWVEHSGSAVTAGEKDLQRLEMRMQVLGLQPLVQNSGTETATGKAIDQSNNDSDMQSWIRSVERALETAYRYAAQWISAEVSDDFSVDIYNDFGLSVRAVADINALQQSRMSGDISRETYLREMKRRGVISDSVDVQEELERVNDEAPALGELQI